MQKKEHFSKILSLIGEQSRAQILWHLLDGKAYTTTELSNKTGITLQSASMHLKKLLNHNIISVERQGRHKYFRLFNEDIAYALESLLNLGITEKEIVKTLEPIQIARTCYDHLAGKVAVELIQALINKNIIIENNSDYFVTQKGEKWFRSFGIDLQKLQKKKRSFSRKCLDWSERKNHLAGALGSAILEEFLQRDWLRRKNDSRELIITFEGKKQFYDNFRINTHA